VLNSYFGLSLTFGPWIPPAASRAFPRHEIFGAFAFWGASFIISMVGFTRIYSDKPGLWSDKFPSSTSREHSRPGCGSARPRAERTRARTHQTVGKSTPPRVRRAPPSNGMVTAWTLGLPILPATPARSLVFVPLCGMKFLRSLDLGVWSLERSHPAMPKRPRLPAPCFFAHSSFYILQSLTEGWTLTVHG